MSLGGFSNLSKLINRPRRRELLIAGAALVPAIVLSGYVIFGEHDAVSTALPSLPTPYQPSFFASDEWDFVNAFVDRLIPADDEGPGAIEAGVPVFIDRQMATPYAYGELWYMHGPFRDAPETLGYQLEFSPRDIYRKGIAAADQAVLQSFGKRFIELSAADRDVAIARMEAGKLEMQPVPAATLFSQFLNNTREGYFSDPVHGGNRGMAAWKMIGFPGARADFTDWVDRYGAKYPFGPVSNNSSQA